MSGFSRLNTEYLEKNGMNQIEDGLTDQKLPEPDVHFTPALSEPVVNQSFPVRTPESEHGEFIVQVRASILSRCRARLTRIVASGFPWHDCALALSTLCLGAFLGALPAKLNSSSLFGIVFYNLFPVIGAASGVAFYFLKKRKSIEAITIANEILEDLPDPLKAR